MLEPVVLIVVLIVSVVLHENAHGVVAHRLGDPTAKQAGRLTLNPIRHLDPVGSVILPAMLAFTAGMAFGYAKPVPVNPRLLRGGHRQGFALVAAAGPASNFLIALVTVLSVRMFMGESFLPQALFAMEFDRATPFQMVVAALFIVNVALAAFNLIPIPPLDGSRFVRLFLNDRGLQWLDRVEPYGFLILFVLIFLLPGPL